MAEGALVAVCLLALCLPVWASGGTGQTVAAYRRRRRARDWPGALLYLTGCSVLLIEVLSRG